MIELGRYTVKFEKNVLYLKIIGPCNKETFERYNAEISKKITLAGSKSFSGVVVLEGECIIIPEVFDDFRKATVVREKTGLTNLALYT